MYFYHSFPRRRDGNESKGKGLKILNSILRNGLLLTPEFHVWRERLTDGSYSKPWTVRQISVSFTLLSPSQPKDHSRVFGEFALEFQTQILRSLGAMPVFYLPSTNLRGQSKGLADISGTMIARVGEIQKLLDRIKSLYHEASNRSSKERIVIEDDRGNRWPIDCSFMAARSLIDFFLQKGQSIDQLSDSLRVISNLFYPTENLDYTPELGYYYQREWRIIAGVSTKRGPVVELLNEKQKSEVTEIAPEFFSEEIQEQRGPVKRIDACRLLREFNGESIASLVNRIVVPNSCINRVREMLSQNLRSKVIGSDSLG